jgi:protein-S-isoprenylcysteine O-methyltransferase Ste14
MSEGSIGVPGDSSILAAYDGVDCAAQYHRATMSTASNAIKTVLFTLFVPLVIGVWVPQSMVGPGVTAPSTWRVAGGLLFVLGAIGYFSCATLFVRAQGTPAPIFPTKSAVVSGLYRINRNPMYCSVLTVVIGQALFYRSRTIAEYALFLFVCFHLFVVFYEERALRSQFDGEYEEFCRQVPRWIPRLHGSSRT